MPRLTPTAHLSTTHTLHVGSPLGPYRYEVVVESNDDLRVDFTPTGGAAEIWTRGREYTTDADASTLTLLQPARAGTLRIYRDTLVERLTAFGRDAVARGPAVEVAFARVYRLLEELTARAGFGGDPGNAVVDVTQGPTMGSLYLHLANGDRTGPIDLGVLTQAQRNAIVASIAVPQVTAAAIVSALTAAGGELYTQADAQRLAEIPDIALAALSAPVIQGYAFPSETYNAAIVPVKVTAAQRDALAQLIADTAGGVVTDTDLRTAIREQAGVVLASLRDALWQLFTRRTAAGVGITTLMDGDQASIVATSPATGISAVPGVRLGPATWHQVQVDAYDPFVVSGHDLRGSAAQGPNPSTTNVLNAAGAIRLRMTLDGTAQDETVVLAYTQGDRLLMRIEGVPNTRTAPYEVRSAVLSAPHGDGSGDVADAVNAALAASALILGLREDVDALEDADGELRKATTLINATLQVNTANTWHDIGGSDDLVPTDTSALMKLRVSTATYDTDANPPRPEVQVEQFLALAQDTDGDYPITGDSRVTTATAIGATGYTVPFDTHEVWLARARAGGWLIAVSNQLAGQTFTLVGTAEVLDVTSKVALAEPASGPKLSRNAQGELQVQGVTAGVDAPNITADDVGEFLEAVSDGQTPPTYSTRWGTPAGGVVSSPVAADTGRFLQATDANTTAWAEPDHLPSFAALPAVGSYAIGDLIAHGGNAWVLADGELDPHVYHGTIAALANGFYGDATFAWAQTPSTRIRALLPKAVLGASPPANLYIRFHQNREYGESALVRDAANDTSTLYAYQHAPGEPAYEASASEVGESFDVSFYTDVGYSRAQNVVANTNRWVQLPGGPRGPQGATGPRGPMGISGRPEWFGAASALPAASARVNGTTYFTWGG